MSGFIAGAPVPSGHINTDTFWPSIDIEKLRKSLRIDSSVTPARLETAIIAAAISVNDELDAWLQAKRAEGFVALTEVPSPPVGDVTKHVYLYLRAIEAATGAEVCERYRGYDTTGSGSKNAEDTAPTIDDYRRDQRWAIRDFLGKSRTTVELL
ncbi:head completion/stabilization protein [Pseudomonas huaxiensis]|uniref:head completion/stabilization protein n=1 Tax=Pseudomonas huaxiensis TaxID=2213017 RepID=UPI000DA644C8|nr:head completion/stabilization protein [Pseudomonas huaxiensis]